MEMCRRHVVETERGDVDAVAEDATLDESAHAKERLDEGAFAGACASDDADFLGGVDVERDVGEGERRRAGRVSETCRRRRRRWYRPRANWWAVVDLWELERVALARVHSTRAHARRQSSVSRPRPIV